MNTNGNKQTKELIEARFKDFRRIVDEEAAKYHKETDVKYEIDSVDADGSINPCDPEMLKDPEEEMFIRVTAWWEVYSHKDVAIDEISSNICSVKQGFVALDYCFDEEEVRTQAKREFERTAKTEGTESI